MCILVIAAAIFFPHPLREASFRGLAPVSRPFSFAWRRAVDALRVCAVYVVSGIVLTMPTGAARKTRSYCALFSTSRTFVGLRTKQVFILVNGFYSYTRALLEPRWR